MERSLHSLRSVEMTKGRAVEMTKGRAVEMTKGRAPRDDRLEGGAMVS
jgi:hypothetical protein